MNRRRGFILVLAILFLALLELLAISVALRVPQGVREAARLGDETAAYLAADAGVRDTIAWLEYQLNQGHEPQLKQRAGQLGDDSWTVDIEPDDYTTPKGNYSCRCYKLNAVGKRGTVTRRIRVSIVQGSFGRYARFFNHWGSEASVPSDQVVYFYGGPIYVNGPVHSNDYLWVAAYSAFYTGGFSHKKLFDTSWVSCVNGVVQGDNYPETPAQLDMIYSSHDPKKTPRIARKIDPPNLVLLRDLAKGNQEYKPLPQLSLSPGGGVYISDDVNDLELLGTKQIYRFGPNSVTVEESGGQVKWSVNGAASSSFDGHLNGLIYAEGDVLGFHGDNSVGNHTLVTDTDPQKDPEHSVTLTGNVTCTPGSRLGVITDHLHLPDYTRLPRVLSADDADPNPVRLDACVYMIGKRGYGGFQVDDMVSTPRRLGEITVQCLVEGQRKRCASVEENSGWNIVVDHSRVDIHNPAPFFPALPKFDITAIESEQR